MKFFYKERHTICVIGIKTWDFSTEDFLKNTISIFAVSGIKEFEDVANTFTNWQREIINSFIITPDGYSLTNGPIEGMNNKVKTIKKLSYGVTNFNHLRLRILLSFEK